MRSLYVLPLLLVLGVPFVFADTTIETTVGSGAPGCEETSNGCYLPIIATVNVGEKVIFSNTDTAAHTFTSGHPDNGPDNLFDTGLLMAGNSFEFVPTSEGQIDYFCMVHPWMTGTIIVGEGDTSTDPIIPPIIDPIIDKTLEIENQQLRDEVRDLKLENRDLQQLNTELQNEIQTLKDQIVFMTNEFMQNIILANEWFRSQLG